MLIAMHTRTAVLLGATGLVGGFCFEELKRSSAYNKITVITRRPLNLAPHPAVIEKIQPDLSQLSPVDFQGADDVFCALGTTIKQAGSQAAFRAVDYELPMIAAGAAKSAGAEQFMLVSSVGADAKSGNFYLRTKGELERDLAGVGLQAVHAFRPGLLLGTRNEFRTGEAIAQKLAPVLNVLFIGRLRQYRSIPAETVGRAMVGAAFQQQAGTHIYTYDEIGSLACAMNISQ